MKNKIPFQYSILQFTYDTFTEERLNIGLALFSPENGFIKIKLLTKYSRITGAFPDADGEKFFNYISRLQTKFDILAKNISNHQIPLYEIQPQSIESTLSQILPIDDTSIRFSSAYFGVSDNLENTFTDLYFRLVERYLPVENDSFRDENKIWHDFSSLLPRTIVYTHLHPITIRTPQQEIEFDHVWKNSHFKALQPLSFDLKQSAYIRRKSLQWFGTNVLISNSNEISNLYYILSKPEIDDKDLIKAYQKAKDLLGTGEFSKKIEIIEEDQIKDFATLIINQIQKDIENETNIASTK